MSRITTIANQKGGVGKTTTAHALATGLTIKGFKTLIIDVDPQGNLSFTLGANDQHFSIYEALKGTITAQEAIQHVSEIDIIASTLLLAGADLEFVDTGREYFLKNLIEPLKTTYDHIIIDTPPTLGILTINALTASDDVIIPMGADVFSLQGLSQLYITIEKVKKFCNPNLEISGLLITRYSGRTILSRDLKEVIENKAAQINASVFSTVIREGIAIKEAQTQQQSIFESASKSNPALDYMEFIAEYLKGEDNE